MTMKPSTSCQHFFKEKLGYRRWTCRTSSDGVTADRCDHCSFGASVKNYFILEMWTSEGSLSIWNKQRGNLLPPKACIMVWILQQSQLVTFLERRSGKRGWVLHEPLIPHHQWYDAIRSTPTTPAHIVAQQGTSVRDLFIVLHCIYTLTNQIRVAAQLFSFYCSWVAFKYSLCQDPWNNNRMNLLQGYFQSHSFSERKQYFLSHSPWTGWLFIPSNSP